LALSTTGDALTVTMLGAGALDGALVGAAGPVLGAGGGVPVVGAGAVGFALPALRGRNAVSLFGAAAGPLVVLGVPGVVAPGVRAVAAMGEEPSLGPPLPPPPAPPPPSDLK
jgi:hypothetical protein